MKQTACFFIPPSCGGAERVTLTIAKLLDPLLFDVKVVIVGSQMGDIVQFIPSRFEIIHLQIHNIWDFTVCRMLRLMKKVKPSVVFSSISYLNTRVILSAKLIGNINIIVRNDNSIAKLRKDELLLVRKLYPKANSVICQTDEMKKEMLAMTNVSEVNLHVLTNPVDVDTIALKLKEDYTNPYDSEYANYVFVGRVHYHKGLDVLLASFNKLLQQQPKSRLYIVGKYMLEDSYYQQLIGEVSKYNIEKNVNWIGFTSNPYRYIKYANCLVLPSRLEGLPNVVLDAMYLQTPVVVTRCVPVIDRIVNSEQGIIVDVEDVEGLASAMRNAIKKSISKPYLLDSTKEILKLFSK